MNQSKIQEDFTLQLLASNLRLDGREPFQLRETQIEFMQDPGSLLMRLGDTLLAVNTAAEIVSPRSQQPSKGFLLFNVSANNYSGSVETNRKMALQLSQLLERIIIKSSALDLQSLCIISALYVWKISVSVSIINNDGNVLDGALNAVVVALMDMRKPLVNISHNKLDIHSQKSQCLALAHYPFSFTFSLINGAWADPGEQEERVCQSYITVTMNIYKEILSIHKVGGSGITQSMLHSLIKIVQTKIKPFTTQMKKICQARILCVDSF